jgi:putative intracellular protease/amidase
MGGTRPEEELMSEPEIVHVAVYDTFADWEHGYAVAHIARPDWQRDPDRYAVRTVGLDRSPVTTMGGLTVVPDLALDEVDPDTSAMLVLTGAEGWEQGTLQPFVDAAAACVEVGTPVAAICGATFALAGAGLLDDRAHTSSAAEFLLASGDGYRGAARYVEADAVADRGVITAGTTQPAAFAREIFATLDLYPPATLAAWWKLFGLNDPAGFFELTGA